MIVSPTTTRSVSVTRRDVALSDLKPTLREAVRAGRRLGLLTARVADTGSGIRLVVLILDPRSGSMEVWEADLHGAPAFPSMAREIPQTHWFERNIFDFYGIKPEGHPRPKSLILHEAWPDDFFPLAPDAPVHVTDGPTRRYDFMTVAGEGVYEIPVGPIHAGIIEPGHFRFSCLGEVIQNLEIRLGYQHRGVERRLTEVDWRKARFLAEAVSSDTTAANALAHAMAVEQLLGLELTEDSAVCRATALEIERIACHIGDLGGLCADIGYAAGASVFGRLRGRALGLGERLTGSRFLGGYILPGGVARIPIDGMRREILIEAKETLREFDRAVPLIESNSGALERMEEIGRVKPSLAADFGLVGPAGRASGVDYDVRRDFRQFPYASLDWRVPTMDAGDVLARARVRIRETVESLRMVQTLLDREFESDVDHRRAVDAVALPPNSVGVGIVEAWRGELIHLVFTNAEGKIGRYAVKDPSFNNWTGLAIAGRGQLVADFPLCNKSFGLSYSGNDL